MHRSRFPVCLLVLLGLTAGLILLVGSAAPHGSALAGLDLAINLYVAPDETAPFAPGSEITYEIYFSNQGFDVAAYVFVRSSLPEHTTYVSSSGPGFTLVQAGPDDVVWSRYQLAGFEGGWLSVTLRVDDDAPVGALGEHHAKISHAGYNESDYTNNESSVLRYVLPAEPDLRVTKHLWPNSKPIAAGNEIVFEIAAENQGGSAASSVRITDTLPAGCTYTSDDPAGSGFTTAQTGQTVVWTRDEMAPDVYGLSPEPLLVRCQVAGDWTPDQWLENGVEISTPDAEYSTDNNLSRWTYKPEADRRYAAAISWVDDRTMRLLSDGGFDYALYYLDWSETEPSDDQYDWGRLDEAVWQAWRHNLRLVGRVYRAPAWARGPGDATAPPSDPAKLGEFLEAVAARWPRQTGDPDQPQIYGYVIWNEPNLAAEWGGNAPDAAAYASLLQAAHGGVKAGSPDAWVISAGLATTGDDPPHAVDDRAYMQQIYDAGAAGSFDYLGANPMGFAYAPDDDSDPNGFNFTRAEAWREIMVANGDGDKDMFGAETGWLRDTTRDLGDRYNWMKVSEIDQAHYLGRAYHKARCDWQRADGTPWMGPLTTWNLDFAAGDYTENDHPYWFAVTDENRQPLRAYLTLQNAATHGPADLWLEKELVEPLLPGQDLRYAIRYTNIGGQTAAGVLMTDTLPAGTEYVSDTGGGTPTPGGDRVIWDLGDVDTCTYEAVTLTLRLPDDPGITELTNRVEVNSMPSEPYTDDNVATVTTSLTDLLAIQKSVTPARVGPGQPLTYTLAFSNTGETLAAGVVISDIVPAAYLTDLSYTHSGVAIAPPGSVSYTWQVEDLSPDESGLITIHAVIKPGTSGTFSLTNRAVISTTSLDFYWGNNRSEVSSTVDGEPPPTPLLKSPAGGTLTKENTPLLTWYASTAADIAGYLLDLNGAVQDVGNVTQHITGALAGGPYTWTVAAYDTVGNTSAYASAWSFTVDTTAPIPPVLASPANGATIADNTPTLIWQASASADAAGYLLDLDGSVQDVGNVTQITTGGLTGGDHTWTVAAYDTAGNTSAYAAAWSFTVDAKAPKPPILKSPADGTLTGTTSLTLMWQASPSAGVTGYLLELDGKVRDVGRTTQRNTGSLADGTHTWRVAAYDAVGNASPYTSTWSFTVDTTAPPPPVLISPLDGARTTGRTLVLSWQAAASAVLASPSADVAGYMLNFDGTVQDLGDVTQHTTGLLAGGTFEWTVAAYDALGNQSAYTSPWSFTIEPHRLYLPQVVKEPSRLRIW